MDIEIINCKDCKYWFQPAQECQLKAKTIGDNDPFIMGPFDYCSDGERKSEIVFCRDCKHKGFQSSGMWCLLRNLEVSISDYCSLGEE